MADRGMWWKGFGVVSRGQIAKDLWEAVKQFEAEEGLDQGQ